MHAISTATFGGQASWNSLHQRDLRSIAGLAAAAAFAAAPVAALAGNEQLEPGPSRTAHVHGAVC